MAEALTRQQELQPLRQAARQTVADRYDLRRVCLPDMLKFVEQAAG
jgi:hypothetical protein